MITALLWDNDGILVDTEALYFRATRETLARVGALLDEASYIELFLKEARGAWHLARDRGASDAEVEELKRLRGQRYAELLDAGNLSIEGAAEAVVTLAARYRMAIVTSSNPDHFERIHRSTGLLRHFELCLTRDQYVDCKPHPEPYLRALELLALPAGECLVIEDSERGLRAASAAGLRCWVVPSALTRGCRFDGAERVLPDLASVVSALDAAR